MISLTFSMALRTIKLTMICVRSAEPTLKLVEALATTLPRTTGTSQANNLHLQAILSYRRAISSPSLSIYHYIAYIIITYL